MPRHRPRPAAPPTAPELLLAVLFATWVAGGCGAIAVADDLPAAVLAEPYEARLSITGAQGAAHVDLFDGTLPDGLVLDGDGTLRGEPLGIGPYPFTVRVVDSASRWTLAPLTLQVDDQGGQAYLGPVLSEAEMNRLCLDGTDVPDQGWVHMMCLPWVRIRGAGMPGQSERALHAGVFWVGPDGVPDGGWGDDLLLRALDADLAWSFEPDISMPVYDLDGPNSPTDTVVDDEGTLRGGERTGPGEVLVSHPDYGAGAFDVLIVPPDFCPSPTGC